uniref:Uncharacterized protein n=1 Tax=Ascaris lumbricoides TaxID=6252 RepID=A0A0M3I373_ASCLU
MVTSSDKENELSALLDEAIKITAKAHQSTAIRRKKERQVFDDYRKLSDSVEKSINSVYNRICGIRDTFTERLKTLENEIIAKSAILTDRALQTPLNDDRHMHHELREIERNLFVLQSTAREFLRMTHKYIAEMSIGEIKEQVEEANVHMQIIERLLNERRLTSQPTNGDGTLSILGNALEQSATNNYDIETARQFLSKMEKAYESLQRFKQTINGSKNESSAERELLRREADDLSSKLKKFCERLITNVADDTVTAEGAVTPKSERILSPTVFLSNDILSTLSDKQALSIDDLSTVQ